MTLRLVNAVATDLPVTVRIVRRTNFSGLNNQSVPTSEQQAECMRVESRLREIEAALFSPTSPLDHTKAA